VIPRAFSSGALSIWSNAVAAPHLRQRRRQRRLPVIHVTNRPNVHVRLLALEFLFGHGV
jgi:hypothetical protein